MKTLANITNFYFSKKKCNLKQKKTSMMKTIQRIKIIKNVKTLLKKNSEYQSMLPGEKESTQDKYIESVCCDIST